MEKPIKNILVPLNFSVSSDRALQLAIAMCKRHSASLHILQVNKVSNFTYPTGKKALLIGMRLESRVAELSALENYAKKIERTSQVKCFYHLEEGDFPKSVAEIAANFYCDIILVQKGENSFPFKIPTDRNICRLINASNCPVMSVPGKGKFSQFRSVLFPVWAKRPIITKLHAALPIIQKNGSNVTLFGSISSADKRDEADLLTKLMASVRELISRSANDVIDEIEYTPGSAVKVIRKASASNTDLIVIAAQTNSGLGSVFRRSYTEFIIDRSPVPVLSVK